MIQKEINEIRRRLTTDKNCISKIYGCYVNKNKEIIARIDNSMALMPTADAEKYLSLFKKTLSGTLGKNLIDIPFSTNQVTDGQEHKLLMKLKDSLLSDEQAREKLFQTVINTVGFGDRSYVILLALDKYDVPFKRSEDDAMGVVEDSASDTIFTYFLCSICPVNEGRTELGYFAKDNEFHSCTSPHIVASPEIGFLFPAFDDRRSNIYNALMYSKDASDSHSEFVDAVFKTEPPMPATEQKNTFNSILAEVLDDDCSFDVVQSVHEQIRERVVEHKETKSKDPLEIGTNDVAFILRSNGIPEEKINGFKQKCKESFSKNETLNPNNIIDTNKFEVVTPQVKITVDPEYTYTLETKIINGRKYILVPAGDGVIVNGVDVNINE